MSALGAQYTEEHPLIKQLRDREKNLISRLGNASRVARGVCSFMKNLRKRPSVVFTTI